MPLVIAIQQQKGGAMKTTLSINMLAAMVRRGMDAVLVDSDPQGTARDVGAARQGDDQPLRIYGIDRPELIPKQVANINAEYVIIDGASKANKLAEAAIKVADLVLIPVQPSKLDVWGCEDLVNMIKDRQDDLAGTGRELKAAFVMTRVASKTKLSKTIRKEIDVFGLPIIEGQAEQRIVYADSAGEGLSVFDWKPKPKAAIAEIELILDNALSMLQA